MWPARHLQLVTSGAVVWQTSAWPQPATALVCARPSAHPAPQVFQKYNQALRLPPIPDVTSGGTFPAASGGPSAASSSSASMDVEALVRHAQQLAQALYASGGNNPSTQQGHDAQELAKVRKARCPCFG